MVVPSAGYGAASRTVSLAWVTRRFWLFSVLTPYGPKWDAATGVDLPGVECVARLMRTRGALRAFAPVTRAATHGVSSARLSLPAGSRVPLAHPGDRPHQRV